MDMIRTASTTGNPLTRRRVLVIGDPAPELSLISQVSAEHAHTPAEIQAALERGPWDAILSSDQIVRLYEQLAYLLEEIQAEHDFRRMAGSSAAFLRALSLVKAASVSHRPVLIYGETGTGKELFARALHGMSPLHDRVLVKVDCAAPREGEMTKRLELSSGGTLFLDDIGALPIESQALVMSAIRKKRTRVIAVTSRDLKQAAEEGLFRGDLLAVLNAAAIRVPPLRERPEDIPCLISLLLGRFSRRTGKSVDRVSPEAFQKLLKYSWPGNIRELEYVLERAVVLAESRVIDAALLPLWLGPCSDRLEDVERQHIRRVLDGAFWVIEGAEGAATKLNLSPSTLRGRMKKLGISRTSPINRYSRKKCS
jgi:formate hydrogenlyase transcriptional activator